MITKLRVFYRKSDNVIVWTSSVYGAGEFPRTVDEELAQLPAVKVGGTLDTPGQPLGGQPEDYACLEVTDQATIDAYLASDENTMVEG